MNVLAAEDQLSAVYDQPGPVATVYLDATRTTESGAQEVELRWRGVRSALAEQGLDPGAHEYLPDGIGALLRYEGG